MGSYLFEFQAVGGHGCQREAKEGEKFIGCGRMGCPDCECKRFVEKMRAKGVPIEKAKLTHWPGSESAVVDDMSDPVWTKRVDNDFFNSKNKPPAG